MSVETSALEAAEQPSPKARHRESSRSSAIEYAESLLVTVLLALFGTTFIVQAFKIPSQSMEPTLLVGDHLLVNKFVFEGRGAWYEKLLPYRPVRRGDIIVFKFPFDDHPHYVKRVIGLPGDRLRIINQHVYINGQPLEEPYVVHDPPARILSATIFRRRTATFSRPAFVPSGLPGFSTISIAAVSSFRRIVIS